MIGVPLVPLSTAPTAVSRPSALPRIWSATPLAHSRTGHQPYPPSACRSSTHEPQREICTSKWLGHIADRWRAGSWHPGKSHSLACPSCSDIRLPACRLLTGITCLARGCSRRRTICLSRRTVDRSSPVSFTTSVTDRRSRRSRSIAAAAACSAASVARSALGPGLPRHLDVDRGLIDALFSGQLRPGPADAGARAPPSAGFPGRGHGRPAPVPPSSLATTSSLIRGHGRDHRDAFTRQKQHRPRSIGHLRSRPFRTHHRREHRRRSPPRIGPLTCLAPHALSELGAGQVSETGSRRLLLRDVMGVHKLTAGDGYTYLTRQVAVHDATDRGHEGLADYYAEKGESPGRWFGAGLG